MLNASDKCNELATDGGGPCVLLKDHDGPHRNAGEPPDFDRLADVCLARVYEVRNKGLIAEHDVVAEALRQVWNARGAADLAQIEIVLESMGDVAGHDCGAYARNLELALRTLDRVP